MFGTLRVVFAFIVGSSLILFSQASPAQTPANAVEAAANAAYVVKDWNKAAQLYGSITAADAKNGRAWYRLGVALHGTGQQEKAISALQRALEAGAPNFMAEYQIAVAYGSLQNKEKAFEYLEKAMRDGYGQPEQMQSEMDLQALRGDPRFAKLVEQATHNQKPCAYAPENRQFDFWVGEWNVVTTNGGLPAGSSRIEKILNDCVILENWTSASSGYEGKSYNTYDTNLKRWEQFWADNSQGMIHFNGSVKEGVMDYWTEEIPQPDGSKLKRHLQFIPQGPDKVRQFSQGSKDGGKTWFVEYDFTYNRVK
jgi:tetratricopeptide (TPR) repeat protein